MPIAEKLAALPVGHIMCTNCGKVTPAEQAHYGRGREFFQHPDHRYLGCGCDGSWYGGVEKLPNGKLQRVA